MFTNTPQHAHIIVAADLAKQYNIQPRQWAKLEWDGEQLVGAEINVNGSTTHLARGAEDFKLDQNYPPRRASDTK